MKNLVTAPTTYPVSLVELKDHCRVTNDFTGDDNYLESLIPVATQFCEDYCSNAFISQTWDVFFDSFPCGTSIELPFGKAISVTTLKYIESDNSETTWDASNYLVDTVSSPGKIDLAYNITWPTATLKPVQGVVVRFVTGYSTVPHKVKQAILIYAALLYESREPVVIGTTGRSSIAHVPFTLEALLADYRMKVI